VNATPSQELIEHLFRQQAGRLTAYLARRLGPTHLDLAEESVQTALLRALQSWPTAGIPVNPEAWLFRVAQNHALDSVRRKRWQLDDGEVALSRLPTAAEPGLTTELDDDELRLIFLCCHPDLAPDARTTLSLKVACGFSIAEIARAFLSDEATIAQRIVRAKRQIRDRQLALELPDGQRVAARLDSVLEVIYFLFNEGYSAHSGENLVRSDLTGEALRLARLLAASAVSAPRVHALAALIAFQSARLAARSNAAGDMILLDAQDQARWDQRLISLGYSHFDQSMQGSNVSRYHIEAAIAATHARVTPEHPTEWSVILHLYDQLAALDPSPVVALNRAVAIAKADGPERALAELAAIDSQPVLKNYHLRFAVRGHLLLDLGRLSEARTAFEQALECPCSEPERRFLRRQLARCIAPEDIPVLYEDEQLLVVVKPSGMLVHPSVREREGTLKQALMTTRPEVFFPHRLDRDTSGLLVVAKDQNTVRQLGFQFSRREVDKVYGALVAGIVEPDAISIDAPLGREASEKPQWNVRAEGKPAASLLRVVERRERDTLVELEPVTGRTNQLRIHCAHIGHPIVGDVWYGGPSASRLMLHAGRLGFHHPTTGETLNCESASPFASVAADISPE
jgi:RNA polymerase sigma-70 factor (ECF subfamily)